MIILGLGSNVGNREQHLRDAVTEICDSVLTNCQTSPVYESQALLPANAPESWDRPFLNMAIKGNTKLTPSAMLQEIKRIEQRIGRKSRGIWSPREIDIDILVYNDDIINTAELTIPHENLCDRDFALIPFIDLAPHWRYPGTGKNAGKTPNELLEQLPGASSLVKSAIDLYITKYAV